MVGSLFQKKMSLEFLKGFQPAPQIPPEEPSVVIDAIGPMFFLGVSELGTMIK